MTYSARTAFLSASCLLLAACMPAANNGNQNSSVAASSASSVSGDIVVTQPYPNQLVTSPLIVAGEARGTWYFEASFPVRLLDAQGNQIAITPAQAQGDWMTANFVPFQATLTFTTNSQTGTLILEKDNPSGLPQNAASVSIPVQF